MFKPNFSLKKKSIETFEKNFERNNFFNILTLTILICSAVFWISSVMTTSEPPVSSGFWYNLPSQITALHILMRRFCLPSYTLYFPHLLKFPLFEKPQLSKKHWKRCSVNKTMFCPFKFRSTTYCKTNLPSPSLK